MYTQFHPFPHLPAELRTPIWDITLQEPKEVKLRSDWIGPNNHSGVALWKLDTLSPLLFFNFESREHAKKAHKTIYFPVTIPMSRWTQTQSRYPEKPLFAGAGLPFCFPVETLHLGSATAVDYFLAIGNPLWPIRDLSGESKVITTLCGQIKHLIIDHKFFHNVTWAFKAGHLLSLETVVFENAGGKQHAKDVEWTVKCMEILWGNGAEPKFPVVLLVGGKHECKAYQRRLYFEKPMH